MIIDAHTHIFPEAVRNQRERFLDNEPAFELIYASPKARMVGADELVAAMDDHGVDKAVTFGFPWRSADIFKRHNDYILESVQRYPDRLIGLCCMDAEQPEAGREVERCLAAGLSGVGELAFYCSDMVCQSLDSMDAIMDLAQRYDCPVMVHTNEPVGHQYPGKTTNTLAQIYAMVKKYATTRLILAHWGGGIFWYNLLKREVTETLANVWFDTAASPFLYRPDIYRMAMELAGEERVLLGTDYPLIAPKRYFDEMTAAGLSEPQKKRVCGLNAAELFKLTDG